jgi:hypothetical protein
LHTVLVARSFDREGSTGESVGKMPAGQPPRTALP